MTPSAPWPTEIRLSSDKRAVTISYDDGVSHTLSAEILRVMSPSAEVQGHSAAERKTVGGKMTVSILRIDPIGSYALRLVFDDLHDTGLYTWSFLRDLGNNQSAKWAEYLSELQAKGLSRERPGQK